MVCRNKKNDRLEDLVTIDNLAAQIKEIYMSTPKTRGIDKLEGWREVAEYVIFRAGIPSQQDCYPEECEHGDWVSRKVEDSSQFTCLDCGQNCWVENQIKDC